MQRTPRVLAFLASSVLLWACTSARPRPVEPARASSPEAPRISQDVRWLADDAREGRRAGTEGEAEAARWLGQRLEALGLEPAGTDGFLQPFEVPLPVRDGGGSRVAFSEGGQRVELDGRTPPAPAAEPGAETQEAPRELVPLFCSSGAEREGRLVFAGYGIASADLKRDDYAGLDVKDAVVLIVRGTPPDALLPPKTEAPAGAENPHGAPVTASGWGGAGAVFYKVMEAKRRGAAAVIVAQHPEKQEPMLRFEEGGAAEARIPALHVSAALAERVLPGFAAAVAALDGGGAPSAGEARTVALKSDVVREHGTAHNVLGRLPGRDAHKTLVIGAHMDHLGRGGPGSLSGGGQGQIHNGADDNASGTATVLEVARCLVAGPPPAGDVLYALWSGEELGLLGSEHWAEAPTVALADVVANVNLDMVGRADNGKLQVLGAGSAKPLAGYLSIAAPRAGLELEVSLSGQGVGGSDHQTFLNHEIPALHLFSGLHPDYHRPSDDHERFEADGARRVAVLVLSLVEQVQAGGALTWVAPPKGATEPVRGGFNTRFGSQPDYTYEGPGLRLGATSPGSPAEKAGLLRGDVIVGFGSLAIDGMADYMYALNAHKPGDVVVVRYLRDGVEETCRATLEGTQVE